MNGTLGHRPLVHIGYHKTATSFLQSNIFSNQTYFSQPWGKQPAKAVEWFILNHHERFSPEAPRQDCNGLGMLLNVAMPKRSGKT